jgi:hypothetical protein
MRTQQLNFLEAIDFALTGRYEVYSYGGYKLSTDKGNLYIRHTGDDRKKRLVNHCELQLMKEHKWYVKGDDSTSIPWSKQLIKG